MLRLPKLKRSLSLSWTFTLGKRLGLHPTQVAPCSLPPLLTRVLVYANAECMKNYLLSPLSKASKPKKKSLRVDA